MKRLLIVLLLAFAALAVMAHDQTVQQKFYEFHRDGHVIDVELDHGNTLSVKLDGIDTGTRTNFCQPVP